MFCRFQLFQSCTLSWHGCCCLHLCRGEAHRILGIIFATFSKRRAISKHYWTSCLPLWLPSQRTMRPILAQKLVHQALEKSQTSNVAGFLKYVQAECKRFETYVFAASSFWNLLLSTWQNWSTNGGYPCVNVATRSNKKSKTGCSLQHESHIEIAVTKLIHLGKREKEWIGRWRNRSSMPCIWVVKWLPVGIGHMVRWYLWKQPAIWVRNRIGICRKGVWKCDGHRGQVLGLDVDCSVWFCKLRLNHYCLIARWPRGNYAGPYKESKEHSDIKVKQWIQPWATFPNKDEDRNRVQ